MAEAQNECIPQFKLYKSRNDDINIACAWVYYPGIRSKKGPRIAKITRKLPDGKEEACYIQMRKADSTLGEHPLWKNGTIQEDIRNNRNIILLSEHYRNILGIDESEFKSGMKINIDIYEVECPLVAWIYKFKLAWQHPEVSVLISLQLSIIALFLGIICFIIPAAR